jgi:T4 RnlA family RNA ligase
MITIEVLNKYHDDGLIYKQSHPSLPLTIWNYTEKVQYESLWDEVTIQCRGLITEDTTGKILIRPFKKFFNYEEVSGKGMLPTSGEYREYVYVQEKMDGSLGILFYYADQWIMATRGSFTSDQAIKGLEIAKANHNNLEHFLKDVAYLVEIIYPDNRIVVDYEEKETVVFLSVVLNQHHPGWAPSEESELNWNTAKAILSASGIPESDIVKTEQHFNFSDSLYQSLKEKNEDNKEGFVLRFHPDNFRMKIKFEDYVKLHKVMTGLSTTAVWEKLSLGENMDSLLVNVPDEFYDKIKDYEKTLVDEYARVELMCIEFFNKFKHLERKQYAQEAGWHKYSSVLFALYSGKQYAHMIWRNLKPKFRKL